MATATHDPAADEITATTNISAGRNQGASIYVGDLDPNVQEEQLSELFKDVGTVLSIRICRDIVTRRSLGYGYVNFQSAADAEKAMQTLNYTPVGNKSIRLMWQQRDPALRYSGNGNIFIKNLKPEMDHKALHDLFASFGAILSAKVITDDKGESRRYGFVHFKDEDAASKAIVQMNGETPSGWEDALFVANFIRRNARIAALIQNFTNVYIKHVLPSVDRDEIEKFFSKFGGITSAAAKKDNKGRMFAFCNFETHDHALQAIEALHDKPVDGLTNPGEGLYIQRAQSRSERLIELRAKYMQRQGLGNNLYVRNFDISFTDENLRELFKGFGEIQSCRVMKDEKGAPRGFGFVSFSNPEQANQALREMNGRMLNGKPLIVNIAQRRDHRISMLQVQFQQRMQAMLHRLPLMPFVAHASGGRIAPGNYNQMVPQGRTMRGRRGRSRPTQNQTLPPIHQGRDVQYVQVQKTGSPGQQARTPPQAAQEEPLTPPLGPLDAEELMNMSEEDRMHALGERLFVKVCAITNEDQAPKITGMFLEIPPLEALALLNDDAKLHAKVDEALCVLASHKK